MRLWFFVVVISSFAFERTSVATDTLVKLRDTNPETVRSFQKEFGGSLSLVSDEGRIYLWKTLNSKGQSKLKLNRSPLVEAFQPNHKIQTLSNPSLLRARKFLEENPPTAPIENPRPAFQDNPEIKPQLAQPQGPDPELSKAWGLDKVGAVNAWGKLPQGKEIVVAVTDTGIDYNHKDLINRIWHNPGEIPGDGIDNDQNGYIDDVVGWDFVSDDRFPYDLSGNLMEILLTGANPGHGTHCAGVVGAEFGNQAGAAGVAPKVKLMALRILSEKGEGDTAAGVKAVDYAVRNGAQIISASWGSMGEEPEDVVLREAIQRAQEKGVLFIAAAGNGKPNPETQESAGYDNDTDNEPVYPASYPHDNIIAVAALDSNDQLADFSNFGKVSVDIGAPGVKILSTVPGDKFQDTIVKLGTMEVTWDGTSMATPFVAGAAAAVWSQDLSQNWQSVKELLLHNAKPITALEGKTVTGGHLDLNPLLSR